MKLAYVDSSVWITYIEGLHSYQQSIEIHLDRLAKEGWFFATSEAVKLEILPKLYATHNDKIIALYQALFDNLTSLDNFPELFEEALIVTQQEGLKAMDAIHVAIAKQQGCQCFVSTDTHFKNLNCLTVVWINLKVSEL